ncbi:MULTISPECIES: penicillin-binding protein 2 [unclassified Pusillimonas]|uniref:peptidoglycan D,D-transpeptidase FtsI family protein n=1 Tax=unclassified Pusillimonas TaxID=2640016 RepID=UPI000B9465FB|nr:MULTISPECIES: penicillin-binding protein 2 [unclassified Pusillimonas]OXR49030.1 cell division protein [Pusillimonas sp. T2]ROT45909.1 penicillin-binding protein 2 [Pusillimonas sp. NJUB218]
MKRFRFYDSPVLNIQMPLWRSRLVLVLMLLGFVALIAKALYLQGLSNDFLQKQGERRYEKTLVLPAMRGKVFDRTGKVVLASSVPVKAIWTVPEDAQNVRPEQLAQMATLLDMPVVDIKARLANVDKNFVYIKRQVAPDVAEKIRQLKVPGIYLQDEVRRFYPEGDMTAHVLGFTNIEDRGIEGIELTFNDALSGQPGSRRVIKDRLGRVVEDVQAAVPPMHGKDLFLSLDVGLQFDLYSALKSAMQEHKATGAAGVVIDVRTGEILALANLPAYNPNDRGSRSGNELRNRAIVDTFEPGSIMKPFTVGLALDLGRIRTTTQFDTGDGKYRYHGATISDVSRNGVIDVAGVLRRSSNIGMTMISEKLSSQEMWTKFTQLGFGRAPDANFPGVAAGRLRPWERWRPIERATMSYGYGLSVSLLQIAHAYSAFARNGDMVSMTLLRRQGKQPTSVQVFTPETAKSVRAMLEAAAGPDGAKLAQVQGYRVAGKSGTARKIVNGKYSTKQYRSSFVGFAPVSNPRIVVAISIDEPQSGVYYGGRVAAPVFANVVASNLRRMGVQPDAPIDSLVAVGPKEGAAR